MEIFPSRVTGYEEITVADSAVGFTPSLLSNADGLAPSKARCKVITDDIRVRMDGTSPTGSVGEIFVANSTFLVYGADNLRNFEAIRDTATNATLQVHYMV